MCAEQNGFLNEFLSEFPLPGPDTLVFKLKRKAANLKAPFNPTLLEPVETNLGKIHAIIFSSQVSIVVVTFILRLMNVTKIVNTELNVSICSTNLRLVNATRIVFSKHEIKCIDS